MAIGASAPDPGEVAPVERLEGAFRRIAHSVRRNMRDFATVMHPDMRVAGWIVLITVLRGGPEGEPVTVGEIITETDMDKSVVSRQLRALGEWGLVTTHRSAADARVVVVEGTSLAHERLRTIRTAQRALYAEVLHGWSSEDVERLETLLNRLADAVVVSGS